MVCKMCLHDDQKILDSKNHQDACFTLSTVKVTEKHYHQKQMLNISSWFWNHRPKTWQPAKWFSFAAFNSVRKCGRHKILIQWLQSLCIFHLHANLWKQNNKKSIVEKSVWRDIVLHWRYKLSLLHH